MSADLLLTSPVFKGGATLVVALFLSACSPAPADLSPQAPAQSVKLATVNKMADQTELTLPAEVVAVKTLDASFEIAGRLETAHLLTGSVLQKGEVLARLDPSAFEQRLREARARLIRARRDAARVEQTFSRKLASQAELDNAKTELELAEIEVDKAQRDVANTTLYAPFDAQVSTRLVENNSYVKAGETIARLQDLSGLHFHINVPERVLSEYEQGASVTVFARTLSAPQTRYELEYVEHATEPDPITQTYQVVFAAKHTDTRLTPGTRAVAHVTLGYQPNEQGVLVPLSALQSKDAQGFRVWQFVKGTGQVKGVDVNVLSVERDLALVTGNVEPGQLVVAAGTAKMREGLSVTAYQSER